MAIDYGKSNEISEIIQKEVYEGLTYVSDIEKICESSGNIRDYKFEEFWQEAAPKLVEVYGGTASTEIIDTIGVEYMKEALQADWNDPFGIELYAADLNGDGVKELFKTDYFAAGWYGLTYVYDVSDGTKKLFTAAARIWQDGDSGIYSDESGGIHLIVKEDYPGCSHYSDTAYFDITYDSVKMPLFTRIIKGENEYENSIYTYCEVIPSFCDDEYSSWRNFDPKSCKYAEKYDGTEYTDENGKMEELIENTVYNGLTFVSELEEFYKGSIQDFEDFDSFWQEASPKLAEIYCE